MGGSQANGLYLDFTQVRVATEAESSKFGLSLEKVKDKRQI